MYNVIMETLLFYIAVIFGLALFGYTFRNGLGDILYVALRKWHHSVFILSCLCAGLLIGLNESHLDTSAGLPSINIESLLPAPEDERTAALIRECKGFVTAKLENRASYEEPDPPLGDVIRIGAKSYWDTCARTFGMNYWKHDISINSENGGHVLCRAYRSGTYRSGNVESWCATVFAPGHKI